MSKEVDKQFDLFVEQLTEHSPLTERQAEVYTLRECDYSREGISEVLDISKGAVDSHYSKGMNTLNDQPLHSVDMHFYKGVADIKIPILWKGVQPVGNFIEERSVVILFEFFTDLVENSSLVIDSDYWGVMTTESIEFTDDYSWVSINSQGVRQILFDPSDREEMFTRVRQYVQQVNNTDGQSIGSHWRALFKLFTTNLIDSPAKFMRGSIPQGEIQKELILDSRSDFRLPLLYLYWDVSNKDPAIYLGENPTGDVKRLFNFSVDPLNWIPIISEMGQGEVLLSELIVSQIIDKYENSEVVLYDPTELYNIDILGDFDLDIRKHQDPQAFYGGKIDSDKHTVIVVHDAHRIISGFEEEFSDFLESVVNDPSVTLITVNQSIQELDDERIREFHNNAVWILFKLVANKDLDIIDRKWSLSNIVPQLDTAESVVISESERSIVNSNPLRFE